MPVRSVSGAPGIVHAAGTAAEDHALDGGVRAKSSGLGEGMDLAIHVQLAHPAGDELGVLRTVVEDEDGFLPTGVALALRRLRYSSNRTNSSAAIQVMCTSSP
jgi:hypothetical protein